MLDVVVVGAGMAGLAAVQVLQSAGLKVLVFEKSRGVGGRMAARRVESPHGEVTVDHGAQYFTARDPEFLALITPLIEQGTVAVWLDKIATLTSEGITWPTEKHTYPRYCCPAGMSAVAKHLSRDAEVHLGTKVSQVRYSEQHWQVTIEDTGRVYEARSVLLTPPPEQSLALLGARASDPAFDPARAIDFAPCLAILAGYPPGTAGFPSGLRWEDDPVVSWSALDATKRQTPAAQTLVVHTTPEFSRAHWEDDPDSLTQAVLAHCAERLGFCTPLTLDQPEWHQLHRWRYSMPTNPLKEAYLTLPEPEGLVLAGCWCAGARVEGAFTSGREAGRALIRCLGNS